MAQTKTGSDSDKERKAKKEKKTESKTSRGPQDPVTKVLCPHSFFSGARTATADHSPHNPRGESLFAPGGAQPAPKISATSSRAVVPPRDRQGSLGPRVAPRTPGLSPWTHPQISRSSLRLVPSLSRKRGGLFIFAPPEVSGGTTSLPPPPSRGVVRAPEPHAAGS